MLIIKMLVISFSIKSSLFMLGRLLAAPQLISIILLTSLTIHLIIAIHTPLTVDEAHYVLYGHFLDWSYFDHPPLVGWLQAVALTLGEQEWQLRLWALLCYALSLMLLHGYTRYLTHSTACANLAALLFGCIPILHVLGIGLVPDSLLLPLSIALIWQAQRTLEEPHTWNWAMIGLLLGLSALSKYTAALFAVGLLLVLLTSEQSWRWFIKARFWLAVFLAGLLSLPIFYWNLHHDWISIQYQLDHGRPESAFEWEKLGQSQLSQLLIYTPLVWLTTWLVVVNIKNWWSSLPQRQLMLFILPALIIFTLSAGKEPSLPHWLAFFYVLLLPLISVQLIQPSTWKPKLVIINLIYGFSLTLIIIVLSLFPKLTHHWSPNPTQDLIGWQEAAEIAQSLRQNNESLIVTHWVDASRIAWYARPAAVIIMDSRFDQFDIWFGSPTIDTQGMLILPPDRPEQSWQTFFTDCKRLVHSGDGFQFFRCNGAKVSP